MLNYAFDIECYPNIFTVVFINCDNKYNKLIDTYVEHDINLNKAKLLNNDVDIIKYKAKKGDILKKLDFKLFVISDTVNDFYRLKKFLKDTELTLYGYNSHGYDDLLLSYIMSNDIDIKNINDSLYKISSTIIDIKYIETDTYLYNLKYNRYKQYISVDLQSLHNLRMVSLKQVMIRLNWYRVQDLPLNPNRLVEEKDYSSLIDYNINDVLATRLLLKSKLDELKVRLAVNEKYKINVLSEPRSSVAKNIIGKYYCDASGESWKTLQYKRTYRNYINFGELLDSKIKFSGELKKLYEIVANTKFITNLSEFKFSTNYKGIKYNLAKGGLHSKDKPDIFIAKKGIKYIDWDVSSYYPSVIINLKITPKHLSPRYYIPIVLNTKTDRIKLKLLSKSKDVNLETRLKAKLYADIYKIVINANFGQFGDKYSFLYDTQAMYKVTLNGQLYLLLLIERLTDAGFKIISANTDGFITEVPISRENEYRTICNNFGTEFSFGYEYTEYQKYIRTSVNDYIAIKTDGSYKLKGDFVYDKSKLHDHLAKGVRNPIVALALQKYYIEGIPIETTIKASNQIYDFISSQNVDRKYDVLYTSVKNRKVYDEKLQKDIRFYASTKGGVLRKYDSYNNKYISILAKQNIMPINDFIKYDDFSQYNIDYRYYFAEARKLITDIEHNSMKYIKKHSGGLFNDY